MSGAPIEQLRQLRKARDEAQRAYAHARQNVVTGLVTRRERDQARSAYLLAQTAYRDALLPPRRA